MNFYKLMVLGWVYVIRLLIHVLFFLLLSFSLSGFAVLF